MKYMYSDSVELPVQRDFIRDLQNLLKTAVDVYPLEHETISDSEKIADELRAKDQKVFILETFERDVMTNLDEMVTSDAIEAVNLCKNTTTEACTSCADQQRAKIESDFDASLNILTGKVNHNSEEVRKILSEFLEFGVYGTIQKYSLTSGDGGALHGEFEADVERLSFVYDLQFKEPVFLKQMVGSFSIPVPGKSGIFRKEDVVKMLDMTDHRLAGVECTDQDLIAKFDDKKGEKMVRIEMDRATNYYSIVYENTEPINLTGDESISKEIDSTEIVHLMDAVLDYVRDTDKRVVSMLKTIAFDGVDVIKEFRVFDVLKVIFSEYGKLANKCITHGVAKGELLIKIEADDGTRAEKYIPISTIESRLSQIGEKGIELADVFGLDALK
ncbi:MAG: hypothetical protein U9N09_04680 [Euryarchaeota archaeon]|nr:hypothetical protein [Euryarchaeota archaeon]